VYTQWTQPLPSESHLYSGYTSRMRLQSGQQLQVYMRYRLHRRRTELQHRWVTAGCRWNITNAWQSQRVARSAQTHLQNSGVTEGKFTDLLSDVEGSSVVLTRASVLWSSPYVVECQRTDSRWGMPICAGLRQKSVTISTSIKRWRKEGQIDHSYPHIYLFWKHGEDWSSVFWDNWSPS